ncbi:hypothetical protein XENOCAPTIV_009913, partial [Xenoophorus captivus]
SLENPTPPYTPRSRRRAFHHRGFPPADLTGPGQGFLPEDEICAELRGAGLHLPKPAAGLRTPRSAWLLACCYVTQGQTESLCEEMKKQRESPIVQNIGDVMLAKSLDLTTKRMIHEGPLIWKVNKDKQIDVEEDRWSHDTDDTPTNTMSNRNTKRQQQKSLETLLHLCINELEPEQPEGPPPEGRQPSVKVVRKGNMFYLVLPSEQGESATDDLPDPPTPTASHFPQPLEEVASAQTQPEEEAADCCPEFSQSETETMQMEVDVEEEEMGPAQAAQQSHVIKNVDEIFLTIEGLTSKLHKLKEIEKAHHKLLESLRDPSFSQESEDQPCCSAVVSRTPSMGRSSGDGL